MIKNKKGVTLIELIIVLSILSIVSSLAYSVYYFGLKNFNTQTVNVNNQSNVRYALSIISKDIRKSDSVTVSANIITIDGTIEYKLDGNVLMKNGNNLVIDIETFNITRAGNKMTMEITSLPNSFGNTVTLSSKIYIRE